MGTCASLAPAITLESWLSCPGGVEIMQIQYDAFLGFASKVSRRVTSRGRPPHCPRVALVHEAVLELKETVLRFRSLYLNDPTDIFAAAEKRYEQTATLEGGIRCKAPSLSSPQPLARRHPAFAPDVDPAGPGHQRHQPAQG